jgi:hypothetical protein
MGERPSQSDQPMDQSSFPPLPLPENDNALELLPKWVQARLPKLRATEKESDPIAHVKFFTPDSDWTWYAFEGGAETGPEPEDNDFVFFGFVDGFYPELGYFTLNELQSARGPMGLRIERDLYFEPTPYSQLPRK